MFKTLVRIKIKYNLFMNKILSKFKKTKRHNHYKNKIFNLSNLLTITKNKSQMN